MVVSGSLDLTATTSDATERETLRWMPAESRARCTGRQGQSPHDGETALVHLRMSDEATYHVSRHMRLVFDRPSSLATSFLRFSRTGPYLRVSSLPPTPIHLHRIRAIVLNKSHLASCNPVVCSRLSCCHHRRNDGRRPRVSRPPKELSLKVLSTYTCI